MKLLVLLCLAGLSHAADIVLPSTALERDAPVSVIFRTGSLATGKGELAVEWRDVFGRMVQSEKIPVELNDETDVGFSLDLRRAVAMQNEIHAHLTFDGINKRGKQDHRDEEARVSFVARPPLHTWWDYDIIMWQRRNPQMFALFKTMGIDGGEHVGRTHTLPDNLLQNDLRWYSENLATDFYSAYHHYYPDRQNGYEFQMAKELYKKDPTSKVAFKRHPSLSDAAWLAKIHDRLVDAARFYAPYRPFFYSLGDETGIAQLAAAWDFDFSDESLVPMRDWLKQRYGTLAALNREWETNFTAWNLVVPLTTNEAMQRAGDNFSSWGDFKEWMDICYSNALKMGTDAIHSVDPEAYVGIGGGQTPGWGGYDYSRMVRSLTAIEPYDIGNNIEIIRSLNPAMAVLTTSFRMGPWEKHRVWYELLHGNRGLILWDDKSQYASQDGTVGARGKEAAPYYNEIRDGLGALLIASRRQADPIAIHYSQPSFRVEWMMDQKPKGAAWVNRSTSAEYRDSNFLRRRESYCRLIEDSGRQYNFVAYGQVEGGELIRGGYRVLILPHSSSISAAEAAAIHEFVSQGGVAVADGEPAVFDEHGRRLPQSQLDDLFGGAHNAPVTERNFGQGKAVYLKADVIDYHRDRVLGKGGEIREMLSKVFHDAGVDPAFVVGDPAVETHVFRDGGVTLVGLHTNPELRIDDLGPPEFKSNDNFAKPSTLRLTLPGELYVYDVRAGKAVGRKREISVPLDPYEPSIFAVSAVALPELRVAAPARVRLGQTVRIGCSFAGATPAQTHVLHVEVTDPSGKRADYYSGNLRAPQGRAAWTLPLAVNDPAGKWDVRVRDLLSGQVRSVSIEVD